MVIVNFYPMVMGGSVSSLAIVKYFSIRYILHVIIMNKYLVDINICLIWLSYFNSL
jgi:hypothetical protein